MEPNPNTEPPLAFQIVMLLASVDPITASEFAACYPTPRSALN